MPSCGRFMTVGARIATSTASMRNSASNLLPYRTVRPYSIPIAMSGREQQLHQHQLADQDTALEYDRFVHRCCRLRRLNPFCMHSIIESRRTLIVPVRDSKV